MRSDIHWRRGALALAVAAMGVVNLASALLSHAPDRLVALRDLVPTEVLDTSRTYTLLAGALLVLTAWGLARGKRRAYLIALFLCAVSVPVNMLKALDLEEATVAAGLMFLLGASADAFTVKSRQWSLGLLRSRAAGSLLALLAYAVAGCWLLEWRYGHDTSLWRALQETAHRLLGVGEPALVLRPDLSLVEQRVSRWFLGSLPVLGLTLVTGLAILALRPVAHRRRRRGERDEVAALLRQHCNSSVGWFALAPDTDHFFSANRRAVIPYRFESGTLLAIGDPVGPPEEHEPMLRAFEASCREHDWGFAFFQATPARLPLYERLGWRALHIGEEPVLFPGSFTLEGGAMGDVRRASRRLADAGLEARMFVPGAGAFDPNHDGDHLLDPLRAISAEWLRHHRGGEKGFCMGRFEPERLPEVWLAVAWDGDRRRVEAFVTWVPVWGRRGWALDLMRRRDDAPAGVMDFLVARSVEHAHARGDAMLSLSLSALVQMDSPAAAVDPGAAPATGPAPVKSPSARGAAPDETDQARAFLMRHLSRFYDFEGLFRWKRKFQPAFEDRYLVYPEPLALPRVVLALVRAQSPGGLRSYLRASG